MRLGTKKNETKLVFFVGKTLQQNKLKAKRKTIVTLPNKISL